MAVTGEPGRPPVRVGIPLADISGGIYSSKGILAALFDRERTGKGRRIEISMFDTMLHLHDLHGHHVADQRRSAEAARLGARLFGSVAGLRDPDGYIVVATRQEGFWKKLCLVLEHPELADDPLYADNATRVKNRKVVVPRLEEIFRTRTTADWLERAARSRRAGGAGQQFRRRFCRAAGRRARDDRRIRSSAGRQSAAAGQSDQDVGHGQGRFRSRRRCWTNTPMPF